MRGPHSVHPSDTAALVGDEPVMLRARGFPVVVARDRRLGAQFVVQGKLGDCILLDDGFQHRRLARDLNIVAIDASSHDALLDFVAGLRR